LSFHNTRRSCGNEDGDSLPEQGNPPPDWFSIQTHSVFAVILFAGASIFGHAEAASALDTQFSVLQHKQTVSSSQNSLDVAFQSFLRRDTTTTPTASRAMVISQFPMLLSSDQSATATGANTKIIDNVAKENPQATQQIIANPIASKSKGASSAKKAQSKPTISTEKSITSNKLSLKGELLAPNVKKIAEENTIDVELICKDNQRPLDLSAPIVKIDRETFQKVEIFSQPQFLQYLPSSVQPLISRQFQSIKVLRQIPNDQLFVASVFAGSLTEMIRTGMVYPLSTVKARVQARTSRSTNRKRPLLRKLRVTWFTFFHEAKRGDLYAGLLPTLLITVPASGVYSGAKEVSRRAFSMAIQFQVFQNLFPGDDVTSSYYSALVVSLLAAFVADIASLAIRTPADVLALRLQVFGNSNVRSDFGNWAKDTAALLPAMIITDMPFLLSRIFLNAAITTTGENLGRYEFETITIGE